MTEFIETLPKAELHLHVEGTLEPEMMFELAARNGVALPYGSVEEVRAAYRFANLQDFLDIYYRGMAVLRREEDFYELARAYLARARRDGVRHAEVFFDPQAHTARGVPFATVVEGLHRALAEAEKEAGMTTRLIMCFLRHLDAADAMATLEAALPYRDRIVAVGLDSSERGNPPSKFREVFERARAEGFLAVAHAGEEGPADYVREAVDLLGVARIDHGNRALDDPELVRRLAAAGIPLTVCPLSNLRLGVVERMEEHPLKRMMDAGLLVTVNSDDPAYFGGYVADNYRAVRDALGLGRRDLVALARNSFRAAFLDEATRARHLADLEAAAAAGAAAPGAGGR